MVHQYIDQQPSSTTTYNYFFNQNTPTAIYHQNHQYHQLNMDKNCINNNNNNSNNNIIEQKKRKSSVLVDESTTTTNASGGSAFTSATTDTIYYNIPTPPKYISFPSINPLLFSNLNNQQYIETNSNDNVDDTYMMSLDHSHTSNIEKNLNKRYQISKLDYKVVAPEKDKSELKLFSEEIKASFLEKGWRLALESEFKKDYFSQLLDFLEEEKESGVTILPPLDRIFRCFNDTPFDKVKVVIIGGESPPSGVNQANGFAFSVEEGSTRTLPSYLSNIYSELQQDLGVCYNLNHGNLEKWAKQGVLLMNSVLTVRKGQPESHQKKGWETFTDQAIRVLSQNKKNLIFLLWGLNAQQKTSLIDKDNQHIILTSSHPSQFSARKGFLGCQHFSKSNNILLKHSQSPIDWEINQNQQNPIQNNQPNNNIQNNQ